MIEEVTEVVLKKRLYKLLEEKHRKAFLPHSRLSDKHHSIKSLSGAIITEGMDRKTKGKYPRTHDLLKLLEEVGEQT